MTSFLTILPLLLLASFLLDALQGRRWTWSTLLLLAMATPALLFVGVLERGPIAMASTTTFLGALVLAWLWMNIVQQWPDRLRFVLVRSGLLGVPWALAVLFNLLIDPPTGWLTLLTGILPAFGVLWSAYVRRVSIRIQVAELSDEAQEALLQKQQRAVENMRKRFRRKKQLASALIGLGASYTKLERMDEAREAFMEAGRLFRAINDIDMQAFTLNYLGKTWTETDPARAVEYFELALAAIEKQERRWGPLHRILGWANYAHHLGVVLNNLGSAYIKLEDANKARPHLQEALDVLDRAAIETPRHRVIVFLNMSELYQLMGQEAEARRWARDAEGLLDRRHFMPLAEVEATRKLIAKHYREKLGQPSPAEAPSAA